MRKIMAALVLITASLPAFSDFTISSGSKKPDEYKNHKCIESTALANFLKAELTPDEICRYGKSGCSSIKTGKPKMIAYCEHSTLSQCFERKAWVTIDQALGVKLTFEPGLITYGLNNKSTNAGKTCAYWD